MYWRSSMIFCVVVLIKVILCPCNTVPSRSLDLYRGRCSFSKKSVKHLAKLASTDVTNDHKTCLWNAVSDIAKSQNSSENIFSNWLLSLPFRPIILNKTIRFFVLEANEINSLEANLYRVKNIRITLFDELCLGQIIHPGGFNCFDYILNWAVRRD